MDELILVGVDGSDTARAAARRAAELAAKTGAALHIVTAFEKHETASVGVGSDRTAIGVAEEARALAEGVADELRTLTPLVTAGAAQGTPQDVLLDEAERRGATLIVVGNRRMQGIRRVLGSVANTVAHHAPCDVYVVKTV